MWTNVKDIAETCSHESLKADKPDKPQKEFQYISNFKGSNGVCSIMWLLAANPTLRVRVLFPTSIYFFSFSFRLIDLNVKMNDRRQENPKIFKFEKQQSSKCLVFLFHDWLKGTCRLIGTLSYSPYPPEFDKTIHTLLISVSVVTLSDAPSASLA